MHFEVPVLGHTRLWRFAEMAVGSGYWDIRFQVY